MPNRRPGRTSSALPTAGPQEGRRPDGAPIADLSSSSRAALPARFAVRTDDPPEHLFRRLLSAYLAGARTFEVVERPRISAATRQVVREFCRRTRHPEIVRSDGATLELTDLEPGGPEPIGERLQRLGETVLAFHRDAVESWDHLPFEGDGAWAQRDDEIDREAWYLERCLALNRRDGTGGGASAIGAWTVARSLERIADHAVTLGEIGPRLAERGANVGSLRELRQFHRQAMAHLEEVLRSPEGSRANDLLDVGEALLTGGHALSERLLPSVEDRSVSPATAAAIARALEAIRRTVAYTQDIAQAFLDHAPDSETPQARWTGAAPASTPKG